MHAISSSSLSSIRSNQDGAFTPPRPQAASSIAGEWPAFWDRLRDGDVERREALDKLAAISASYLDEDALFQFASSLWDRGQDSLPAGAVNIVGTGGGIPTFNISTAAAFLAATLGVRVIKTGSRAYRSRLGSIDILELLGVSLTQTSDELAFMLQRFGIAFAGYHVYPRELPLLAKVIWPTPVRDFGRLLNAVGPFIAQGANAQLTGVADPDLLPPLRRLMSQHRSGSIWLCTNTIGADELISFAENTVFRNDGRVEHVPTPGNAWFGPGDTSDLAPAVTREDAVVHFCSVLAGHAPRAVIDTVCLNAAALMILGGASTRWTHAIGQAKSAVFDGRAIRLLRSMRGHAGRGLVPANPHSEGPKDE